MSIVFLGRGVMVGKDVVLNGEARPEPELTESILMDREGHILNSIANYT